MKQFDLNDHCKQWTTCPNEELDDKLRTRRRTERRTKQRDNYTAEFLEKSKQKETLSSYEIERIWHQQKSRRLIMSVGIFRTFRRENSKENFWRELGERVSDKHTNAQIVLNSKKGDEIRVDSSQSFSYWKMTNCSCLASCLRNYSNRDDLLWQFSTLAIYHLAIPNS